MHIIAFIFVTKNLKYESGNINITILRIKQSLNNIIQLI